MPFRGKLYKTQKLIVNTAYEVGPGSKKKENALLGIALSNFVIN